jgi:NIMA (never in mitosis gene a)-related kinase 9
MAEKLEANEYYDADLGEEIFSKIHLIDNIEEPQTAFLESQQSTQEETYVFVKFLGQGSFGKVNLYRNATDNSLVVWKEISLKKMDAKMQNEAFAEVEILSMLDHPNIISYYKHFIAEDILYIELEYAKAGTLSTMIKQQQQQALYLDEEIILWYLYQLCNAVDYIHEIGIMHR